MSKELSIEIIKKDIIDKLMNDVDVINYFKEYLESGTPIPKLYNRLIFDYDINYTGDYISVEVSELDDDSYVINGSKKYLVAIKMGLKKEENICALSSMIVDIIDKLYPNRRNFSNVSFRTVNNCLSISDYGCAYTHAFGMVSLENQRESQLHRMITFEIR